MSALVLAAGRTTTNLLYHSLTDVLTDLVGPSANSAHTADGVTWFVVSYHSPGKLYRYDGVWTDLGRIGLGWQYADDVFALSDTRAIVAYSSTGVREYDGGAHVAHTPSVGCVAFGGVPTTDRIYMLSSNRNLYYWERTGTVWTLHSAIPTTFYVRDICVVSADDIWVVCGKYAPYSGELWRYSGGAWALVYSSGSLAFAGVAVVGSTVFLSADANGVDTVVLRSTNGGASFGIDVTTVGCSDLAPVRAVSATEAYVSGAGGHLWRRDTGGWVQLVTGSISNMQRLYPWPLAPAPSVVFPIKLPACGLYIDQVREG